MIVMIVMIVIIVMIVYISINDEVIVKDLLVFSLITFMPTFI